MTTLAKASFKTQIQLGDAATPELFATIAEMKTIEPPEATAKSIDVTSHDSVKAEFINGYVDEGELSLAGNWTGAASQTGLVTLTGGLRRNWQLCFPDWGQATQTFTAAVTDIVTANGHLLTTGQPVRVSSSIALPAGLSAGVTYWVHWADANTFTLHGTNAGAVANTGKVDITDTGSGTHTIQKGTRLDFAANTLSAKLGAPLDGAQEVSFKLKVTGAVTWNV
jgi:hypothetical protein